MASGFQARIADALFLVGLDRTALIANDFWKLGQICPNAFRESTGKAQERRLWPQGTGQRVPFPYRLAFVATFGALDLDRKLRALVRYFVRHHQAPPKMRRTIRRLERRAQLTPREAGTG
jgi:hypothetical protein